MQTTALRVLPNELDDPVLIVDDGAYEIADIVAIERVSGTNRVHLVHCKYSSGDAPGGRLGDIYELTGQCVRSARWTDSRACWGELARRVRDRAATTVQGLADREVTELLDEWAKEPPAIEFHVWAVQPGLSRSRLASWTEGQTILLAAMEWCLNQGASFHVVGSM